MKKLVILCLLGGIATPTFAAEKDSENQWRADISGGATMVGGVDDQTYANASVTRLFGNGYIQISGTLVDAGDAQGLIFAVPATSRQVRLSGGLGIGDVSLDGYVTVGQRKFDDEILGRDGNPVIVTSDGDMFGTGVSLTYDIALGESGFLSPSLSVDFNSVDIGRAITLQTGRQATVEEKESGVSGTFSAAYTHMFGPDSANSIGPFVALVASSNSTAFSPGSNTANSRMAQLVAVRNQPGQGDVWAEFGASASFGLTKNLRLNLYATQSIGFLGPEATSVGSGLSLSF